MQAEGISFESGRFRKVPETMGKQTNKPKMTKRTSDNETVEYNLRKCYRRSIANFNIVFQFPYHVPYLSLNQS